MQGFLFTSSWATMIYGCVIILKKNLEFQYFLTLKNLTLMESLFFIGHGDGLGPNDKGYKRMKKIFKFPFFQWLFRWLHPDLGMKLGQYMSVKNKLISGDKDTQFWGMIVSG